jgi:hypothetical protein
VIRRIIAMGIGLSLISISAASADEVGGEDIVVPSRKAAPAKPMEKPVTAPPPAWVELERTSVAAGLGIHWGGGTLQFETPWATSATSTTSRTSRALTLPWAPGSPRGPESPL